jgi:hypothetical protein
MDKREVRISQSGFARMQETLLRSECEGYGPDACAAHALHSVGLSAKPGVETVLIVDPTLMSHFDYLKAAKIAPIMIVTREESGITNLIGRGHAYDDQSLWVDARYRVRVINLAMRIAGQKPQRETVVAALNQAAKRYNVSLTPHLITIARAMRLSTQLDKILEEMKTNGTLKYFHQEYARRRALRLEQGSGFMNFATAQRRFRSAIIARLVGAETLSDSRLIDRC